MIFPKIVSINKMVKKKKVRKNIIQKPIIEKPLLEQGQKPPLIKNIIEKPLQPTGCGCGKKLNS